MDGSSQLNHLQILSFIQQNPEEQKNSKNIIMCHKENELKIEYYILSILNKNTDFSVFSLLFFCLLFYWDFPFTIVRK